MKTYERERYIFRSEHNERKDNVSRIENFENNPPNNLSGYPTSKLNNQQLKCHQHNLSERAIQNFYTNISNGSNNNLNSETQYENIIPHAFTPNAIKPLP